MYEMQKKAFLKAIWESTTLSGYVVGTVLILKYKVIVLMLYEYVFMA